MKYFTIKSTSEKKIIGNEFPQIQTMAGSVNRADDNSVYNVFPDAFPEFVPNLNYFVLHRNSKVTDVLSASMISGGFIVNTRVREILEKYSLPEHRFYPATVECNNKLDDNYAWFFFVSDVLDFIDYGRTKFYLCDMLDNRIRDCQVDSANNLRAMKDILQDDRNINSDHVYLMETFHDRFDIFKVTFGDYRTYVSERLKDAFDQAGITGLKMLPTESIEVD